MATTAEGAYFLPGSLVELAPWVPMAAMFPAVPSAPKCLLGPDEDRPAGPFIPLHAQCSSRLSFQSSKGSGSEYTRFLSLV